MSAPVQSRTVEADEAGMRLDRWFKAHFPGLGFGQLQRLLRTGQVRVDGGRVRTDTRLAKGQSVRIPPFLAGDNGARPAPLTAGTIRDRHDADVLDAMLLHEDDKVFVFNKPAGLAVQGGSGVSRHVDQMLEALRNRKGEKPRLVHRIDRDTSGILVVARTRGAAVALTKAFRERDTEKVYWAVCRGVPSPRQGRISTHLVREKTPDGDRMRVARHGEPEAEHAESLYRVIDSAGQNLSWVELRPVTGRTHQLRVHMAHLGHPIIGDPKYFDVENWQLPGGIQKRLHLHARRIRIPHPDGGMLDVAAPLPPHMTQTFNLLGFDESSGEEAP
ncbi:MAG: pseudouridine synthase [Alphaproteobacteria bacterium]|nr:MAG: pseudouridine synthase [Alphaproteobacteria bacterium]